MGVFVCAFGWFARGFCWGEGEIWWYTYDNISHGGGLGGVQDGFGLNFGDREEVLGGSGGSFGSGIVLLGCRIGVYEDTSYDFDDTRAQSDGFRRSKWGSEKHQAATKRLRCWQRPRPIHTITSTVPTYYHQSILCNTRREGHHTLNARGQPGHTITYLPSPPQVKLANCEDTAKSLRRYETALLTHHGAATPSSHLLRPKTKNRRKPSRTTNQAASPSQSNSQSNLEG